MLNKYRILIADDDSRTCEILRARLTVAGYDIIEAHNGIEALEQAQAQEPDMLILDILMPKMDGFEVLQELHKYSNIPVIILSSQRADISRIKGLNLGADDYIIKPFNIEETMARIETVKRRVTKRDSVVNKNIQSIGNITLDFENQSVSVSGKPVQMTYIEWQLIIEFAASPGRLIQYEHLLSKVWGVEYRDDVQLLRTWISRLRKKLEYDPEKPIIRTVRNIGYILES